MGIVVVGLVIVVLYMAAKSPMVGPPSGELGPDTNIPALGATDKFSPALTGGMPNISRANRVRLNTNYENVNEPPRVQMADSPPSGSSGTIFGGLTNQDNDGGYKREVAPSATRLTPVTRTSNQGFKF